MANGQDVLCLGLSHAAGSVLVVGGSLHRDTCERSREFGRIAID
ncbi:hypothetical protein [Streptomyces fulvoviolaceus]|nr:hypothetical protein [Streptomyces fulvoviolaceus]